MPILNVGTRLASKIDRLDLARELIGIMFHPLDPEQRRQRQAAFAVTLLGMRDAGDEPEALRLAKRWFRKGGGFKTDDQAERYHKQQDRALNVLLSRIFPVGTILHFIWAMDLHHSQELVGGASVNKAIAIIRASPSPYEGVSERTLRTAWERHKSAAHICAAFALIFNESGPTLTEKDEALKTAAAEKLHTTLGLVAAYQRFVTTFVPHGSKRGLLDPAWAWMLCGVEADDAFIPAELSPDILAVAKAYRAPRNVAFR
jgi:hypothetical protein